MTCAACTEVYFTDPHLTERSLVYMCIFFFLLTSCSICGRDDRVRELPVASLIRHLQRRGVRRYVVTRRPLAGYATLSGKPHPSVEGLPVLEARQAHRCNLSRYPAIVSRGIISCLESSCSRNSGAGAGEGPGERSISAV